jgi:hypothetical protein
MSTKRNSRLSKNIKNFRLQMSQLQIGDIIRGYYVDQSPRYYKVIKITPHKVKVLRLKHTRDGPGKTTYGQEIIMTKKEDFSATHYGMICSRITAESTSFI